MGNPYTPRAHQPSRTGNPARDEQQANATRAILRNMNMGKRPREDEREGVDASAARNVRSNRSRAASATENLESSEVGLLAMATVAIASPPGSDEEGCDEDEDEPDQEAQVAMYHKSMMEENTSSPGRPKEVQYAKEMQRYYEWVADKKRVAGKCLTAAEYVLFRYDTAVKAEDPLSTGQVNMLLNAVNFALEEARKSETDPEKLAQHDEMKLRAHPHVKSLVANVNKAQGTRKWMKQAPVLQKHKDVLTREMMAKGAYTLMRKTFDEGFGDFPPAFDTIRRQPDWTVKLLNSDVKYTYKAKRMLSYILRRKTAEGNVDTVLEELQNDFSAVNGGMVKWMKVKQSLFGDDVSAFTQRIAKRSASIQTHRAAPVVHQVPVDGSTLVHVSS